MQTAILAAWTGLKAGGLFVYPLLAVGVLGIACSVDRAYAHLRHARLPRSLARYFDDPRLTWREIVPLLEAAPPHGDYVGFFRVIIEHAQQPVWWIESRAADRAARAGERLEQGLWILETVVTAAPLLGLLGTISGMVGAFRLFGGGSAVDPAAVTGGVAEALISTAVGIGIALMALTAFNFFSQRNALILDEMERLGTRLIDRIRLDRENAP